VRQTLPSLALAHKFAGQWWPMAVFYSLIAATSLLCVLSLARRHASAERVELTKA
jgi:hypothetical protein